MSLRQEIEDHLTDTFVDGGCGWDEVAQAVVDLLADRKPTARPPHPETIAGGGHERRRPTR